MFDESFEVDFWYDVRRACTSDMREANVLNSGLPTSFVKAAVRDDIELWRSVVFDDFPKSVSSVVDGCGIVIQAGNSLGFKFVITCVDNTWMT